jgi:hypothetical protein
MTHQPGISFSISFQHHFNRAGGRTSNVPQKYMIPRMKTRIIALLFLLPPYAEAGNAKIDALVQTFEGGSLWSRSSVFPVIELAADASITQVLDRLKAMKKFADYKVIASETASLILNHVPVRADGTTEWTPVKEPITVVLITTDIGEKIVFMLYDKENKFWKTTVYNTK